MLLQVMEELVSEAPPTRARGILRQWCFLAGPGVLVDCAGWLQQYGAQREAVMAVERLVTEGNAEEAGIAEGLVIAGGLDVSPERLGAGIDAEDQLRVRPGAGHPFRPAVSRQLAHQMVGIGVFVGRQPNWPVLILRKALEPAQQGLGSIAGQLADLGRSQPQDHGQLVQAADRQVAGPRVPFVPSLLARPGADAVQRAGHA